MTYSIQIANLTLGYQNHPAVHHLSGTIAAGEKLAIIGPNGGGKSTLLKGIAGLLKPIEGQIVVSEKSQYFPSITYLSQISTVETSFPICVRDFIAFGLWRRFGAWRKFSRSAQNEINETLEAVGLSEAQTKPIGQLSGGQLQRARFARAMLQNAQIVLLDEPFNAIDQKTTEDLCALIDGWHECQKTVVCVLHDLHLVKARFPRTLLLARDAIAWGDTHDILTEQNWLSAQQNLMDGSNLFTTVCLQS